MTMMSRHCMRHCMSPERHRTLRMSVMVSDFRSLRTPLLGLVGASSRRNAAMVQVEADGNHHDQACPGQLHGAEGSAGYDLPDESSDRNEIDAKRGVRRSESMDADIPGDDGHYAGESDQVDPPAHDRLCGSGLPGRRRGQPRSADRASEQGQTPNGRGTERPPPSASHRAHHRASQGRSPSGPLPAQRGDGRLPARGPLRRRV